VASFWICASLLKVSAGGQNAAHEEGRIDGRELAFLLAVLEDAGALPGLDVHPMVEPAVLARRVLGEELQGGADARQGFFPLDPAALGGDAHTGQAEAGDGDAADIAPILFVGDAIGAGAAARHSAGGLAVLPEVLERTAREIFQEPVIVRGKPGARA